MVNDALEPKSDDLGGRLVAFDAWWTRIETKLCTFALLSEIFALVVWVSLRGLSTVSKQGDVSGLFFRAMVSAVILGVIAHRVVRPKDKDAEMGFRESAIVTVAVLVGLASGALWRSVGIEYASNALNWMQNASVVMLFGGLRGMATRLTLWVALLGASLATAQGKHINIDVVMRFAAPKLRAPIAILGWLVAAIVCFSAAIGFSDHIAIADFKVDSTIAPGEKIHEVSKEMGHDAFLFGRQASLDVRSLPRVIAGQKYDEFMTGSEWNEWVRSSAWSSHYPEEAVKTLLVSEDGLKQPKMPAVNIPGGAENPRGLFLRELNFVLPIGLLFIGLRFILRILLVLTGRLTVDPDAAHANPDSHANENNVAATEGAAE